MEQLFIKVKTEEIKICAFTGHRHLPEDFSAQNLYNAVLEFVEKGVYVFYNGMAMGFDLLAAEIVLCLKEFYPKIRLIACVPCYGQEKSFSAKDKNRYVEILKKADDVQTLSDHYFRGCMQERDRYMVDKADMLIAYCKKEKGGAAFTVGYCKKKYPDKEIVYIE